MLLSIELHRRNNLQTIERAQGHKKEKTNKKPQRDPRRINQDGGKMHYTNKLSLG